MSTTQTTSGSNTSNLNFNPIAQGVYNLLAGQGGNVLQGYINNPFGNAIFNQGQGAGQAGAQQAGANNLAALGQNAKVSGITGPAGAGWMGSQTAQTQRANQALSSQASLSNYMSALQRQMGAAGTGLSFSPQLTGQSGSFTQTGTSGGLFGSLLPMLAAGGGSAALGAYNSAQANNRLFTQPTGGSVGSTYNPGLMTPSYMPSTSASMAGDSSYGIAPNVMYPPQQPPAWLAGQS